MNKAEYVRGQPFSAGHKCHWPGCERDVKAASWGCPPHWYKLPIALRTTIWRAYKPGQEISKTPSADYVAVAREVEAWIKANA